MIRNLYDSEDSHRGEVNLKNRMEFTTDRPL